MKDAQPSPGNWFDKKISLSLGKLSVLLLVALLCFLIIRATNSNLSIVTVDDKGLEIGRLIRDVKRELVTADTARINNNEPALFKLKDFQMEISFMVKSEYKGGTKVDYKFVTVEGNATTGNEKVQKLVLRWDAISSLPDTLFAQDDGVITIKPPNNQKHQP